MQRIATHTGGWTCARGNSKLQEGVGSRVLDTVWEIIKDSLVMSVVVMTGAALTLLLG